jgi:SAM-dependent methyltransferase
MRLASILAHEVRETLRRPSRLLNLFRLDRLTRFLSFQRVRRLSRDRWGGIATGMAAREVGSYEDYVRLQRSKLEYLDLSGHEDRFRTVLRERMRALGVVAPGARVLCLGARRGGEVAAFRDLGCFAVGIDLNPGADNPWVLYGDFHRLEFADACVDVVYSNSLDHSLDLSRLLGEARRVLVPGGRLVVEADPGAEDPDGAAPDLWATLRWSTVAALRERIEAEGLSFVAAHPFAYPRHGTCLLFTSGARAGA